MTEGTPIAVLVAEDDASVRDALATLIRSEPGLDLVATAADADEAIALASSTRPTVAIVDVRMPGGGGVRAAEGIARSSPATKVLALSAFEDKSTVLEMLQAGAVGYLVKGGPVETILEAIGRAAGGQSSLSVEVTGDVIDELVEQLSVRRRAEERLRVRKARIEGAIGSADAMYVALQPICSLNGRQTIGAEALARFERTPVRTPDRWFAEASEVGLRDQLELAAARLALARLSQVPKHAFLSVNLSPETLATSELQHLVAEHPGRERLVLEITEHAPIRDYPILNAAIEGLRELGVRLAIDDAGAGFASLRHILRLAPEFIKLDMSLISGIERDRSQQALAVGLISFADRIGATIVAEGIERVEELNALRTLGVRFGQGYFLGRPVRDPGPDAQAHGAPDAA
jgi:EAL domain-containing protein (putative c-di-GMP-specific phosphodiesterase class I)/CheY-like chemotaxis protein